ncbi:23S rRNA (adenine(2030)-N(6))-methyltransferase RlmJ [Methylovirgula sp. HY1]|uniref:23S rRNA (adenine(2030)-N(6))-methyltransferase RlmJ n=1 Tax=Methylovirgula sp. HY1 TaxID=2822761 RepID=UPI001C5B323E|nr:23S rRNA (adenine(2030)-N(6))-methyltransferase RlmJ [Methylovirgula sp. HY1]QXX76340.1 Ribosomal RNA large subunit methyltransferase J [Methylovirgula sp. HY1]
MNYRHAYHAGNFADVFKHVVLTLILAYLGQKPTGFRVIDTHAGDGLYDLSGVAAEKTAEWRNGIGRLIGAEIWPELQPLLDPYLAIVAPRLTAESPYYPGSPLLAAALLRKQDRMIFCEAHPEVVGALKAHLGRDKRAKIIEIDGFVGLGAFVPPIERRGLVLVDPPFEAKDEFVRIAGAIDTALRKWPTGTYMIWFPIKDRAGVARFYSQMSDVIAKAGVREALCFELWIDDIGPDRPLAANGLVVINPPYVLDAQVRQILPYLARVLSIAGKGGYAVAHL